MSQTISNMIAKTQAQHTYNNIIYTKMRNFTPKSHASIPFVF